MVRIFVAAALLAALSAPAWAKCPMGTSYQCHQGMNGKVICGCR